jgi:hypothetical protein
MNETFANLHQAERKTLDEYILEMKQLGIYAKHTDFVSLSNLLKINYIVLRSNTHSNTIDSISPDHKHNIKPAI